MSPGRPLVKSSRRLLNEATSALDSESKRSVEEALHRAPKSRTTVAVAHRMSSIYHADINFLLDGLGGGHYRKVELNRELMVIQRIYSDMVKRNSMVANL
jgi:ABC-type multidrug transport system fused ATPase/permease subunit